MNCQIGDNVKAVKDIEYADGTIKQGTCGLVVEIFEWLPVVDFDLDIPPIIVANKEIEKLNFQIGDRVKAIRNITFRSHLGLPVKSNARGTVTDIVSEDLVAVIFDGNLHEVIVTNTQISKISMPFQIDDVVVLVKDFTGFAGEVIKDVGSRGCVTDVDDNGCDIRFEGDDQLMYIYNTEIKKVE